MKVMIAPRHYIATLAKGGPFYAIKPTVDDGCVMVSEDDYVALSTKYVAALTFIAHWELVSRDALDNRISQEEFKRKYSADYGGTPDVLREDLEEEIAKIKDIMP